MASDLSQKRVKSDQSSFTPIIKEIVIMLSRSESFKKLIDKGYTHWQISTGLREAINKGFVIRKDDEFFPASAALGLLSEAVQTRSKRPLEPLNEFRVEKIPKNRSYEPGRQALEQIRGRIRT